MSVFSKVNGPGVSTMAAEVAGTKSSHRRKKCLAHLMGLTLLSVARARGFLPRDSSGLKAERSRLLKSLFPSSVALRPKTGCDESFRSPVSWNELLSRLCQL